MTMTTLTDDELAAIQSAPLDTRRRWFAALNSYELPDDFPARWLVIPQSIRGEDRKAWSAVFRAVDDTLPCDESSWGWWKYSMERPFAEWLAWWTGRGLETTITEETA